MTSPLAAHGQAACGTPRAGQPAPAPSDGLPVTIGEAAKASEVSAKMIRHYESLGLLGEVARTDSGYRLYSASDIHSLQFIKRARDLGFSMAEIKELVSLWHDQGRASSHVKAIAQAHLSDLEERIQKMQAMRQTLTQLVAGCQGNNRPTCPILADLAGDGPASACCT